MATRSPTSRTCLDRRAAPPADRPARRRVGVSPGRPACRTIAAPSTWTRGGPCPRSARFAACASNRITSATSRPWSARRMTSSPRRSSGPCSPGARATSSGSTCRRTSSATSPTTAIGGLPGPSPPGAPMARSARIPGRACTSTSRPTASPGTDVERVQRGFFGRLRLEPFGPGGGVLPHERTMSGPKEDRYKLLRATGANLSPVVGLFADPTGAAEADPGRGRPPPADDRAGRRRRRGPPAVARPDRGHERRSRRRPRRAPHRRGTQRPRDDRRRAPPLRDRAPLPRRAADEPGVRGGPAVRLRPDAVPRDRRPGR